MAFNFDAILPRSVVLNKCERKAKQNFAEQTTLARSAEREEKRSLSKVRKAVANRDDMQAERAADTAVVARKNRQMADKYAQTFGNQVAFIGNIKASDQQMALMSRSSNLTQRVLGRMTNNAGVVSDAYKASLDKLEDSREQLNEVTAMDDAADAEAASKLKQAILTEALAANSLVDPGLMEGNATFSTSEQANAEET